MMSRRKTSGARRLTARSVIASTLLGVDPPELPTPALVATAELLGVTPGTARVAMSRMVASGELEPTDGGYRLASSPLLSRSARQGLSRRGVDADWNRRWRIVVAPEGLGSIGRIDLRAAFVALRFAPIRDGVWMRPDNLPTDVLVGEEEEIALHGTGFDAYPDAQVPLAARLWDLAGWAAEAKALTDDLAACHATLLRDGPTALADGFLVSAAVLRHFQADPLLPPALLAKDWPGPALRQAHHAYDVEFKITLATWQRTLPVSTTR